MSQKTASSNKIEDTLSKKYIPKKEQAGSFGAAMVRIHLQLYLS